MSNIALITGVTGQDGSYLSELLLLKNYKVYGLIRRSSSNNLTRLKACIRHPNFKTLYGDLGDASSLSKSLQKIKDWHPTLVRLEIYNLGAQSHVQVSFEIPEYTCDVMVWVRFVY